MPRNFISAAELILELANYHWRGDKRFPSGYGAPVMVVDPNRDSNTTLPMGYRTVTEAGWVSEHEYNEGASSSPIIMPEELAHHYSGQADYTRGFQEWLLRVVLKGVRGGGEGG